MGGSQPGASGLSRPWATYMSPKFFLLLMCLKRAIKYFPTQWPSWDFSTNLLYLPQVEIQFSCWGRPSLGSFQNNKPCAGMDLSSSYSVPLSV
jgi:hypothetical protein